MAMMTLYKADYLRWTEETAERLRRRGFDGIELQALVEEIESWGKREKYALQSRLAVLMAHLLKWDKQRAKRSRSWQATIDIQRSRIERLLKQSPSLRPYLDEILDETYCEAVLLAIKDTGLDRTMFPAACPFNTEQLLSRGQL